MHKYLLLALGLALQPTVWAGWVYFTNNNHGSNDYYYAPLENKGKVKVLRTFTQLPVDAKVPFHTPKAVVKVMLYNYASEQSTYEINCQEQSIQFCSILAPPLEVNSILLLVQFNSSLL